MSRPRGWVPSYWWDFRDDRVIVETDDPRTPDGIADWRELGDGQSVLGAIEWAESRVLALQQGRG